MRTYYVATRILFVLVPAASDTEARKLGQTALDTLYQERLRRPVSAEIQMVRLATDDEIDLERRDAAKDPRRRTVPAAAELVIRSGGELTTEFL